MPKPPEKLKLLSSSPNGDQRAAELAKMKTGIETRRMLADLGGTVPREIEIPADASVTHIDATTHGRVVDDLVKIREAKINAKFKTPDGGDGKQKHERKTEVSLKNIPEIYKLRMQGDNNEVFMDVFGNLEDGNRFEGQITLDLPLVVPDGGDVTKYERLVKSHRDLNEIFVNLGGLANYPHAEFITALVQKYPGTTITYEIETEGKLDTDTEVFSGRQEIIIKFSHDAAKVNEALKKVSNTYRPREETVKSKEAAKAVAPAKKDSAPEKNDTVGRQSLQLSFNVKIGEHAGKKTYAFSFKGPVPDYLKGATINSQFEKVDEPGCKRLALEITMDGKTYVYKTRNVLPLKYEPIYGFNNVDFDLAK